MIRGKGFLYISLLLGFSITCKVVWPQSQTKFGLTSIISGFRFGEPVVGTIYKPVSAIEATFDNTAVYGLGFRYERTSSANVSWELGVARLFTGYTADVRQLGRIKVRTAPSYLFSAYLGYNIGLSNRFSVGVHTGFLMWYRSDLSSAGYRAEVDSIAYGLYDFSEGNMLAIPLRGTLKYSLSDLWTLSFGVEAFALLGTNGYGNYYSIAQTDLTIPSPASSITEYYYDLQNPLISLGLYYGLPTKGNQDTWIELKMGGYFQVSHKHGVEEWVDVKHEVPIQIGAALNYRIDRRWRVFLEVMKAYGVVRHRNLLRQNDVVIDLSVGLTSVFAGAGYSIPISKHFNHGFQLSAGIHATGKNGYDSFGRGDADTTFAYAVHSDVTRFDRAFGYTAEYSLDYTPGKHFTISAFAGMRQLLSSKPYYLIETTFTEKATGDIHAEHQYKIRKLMFHAGLGISFPL